MFSELDKNDSKYRAGEGRAFKTSVKTVGDTEIFESEIDDQINVVPAPINEKHAKLMMIGEEFLESEHVIMQDDVTTHDAYQVFQ